MTHKWNSTKARPIAILIGLWAKCNDYKCLNALTDQLQFQLSYNEELLGSVGGANVLSKLDLSKDTL